jgi:ABC-type dipeptide/oligopeptide/nickel transport system ATPase component
MGVCDRIGRRHATTTRKGPLVKTDNSPARGMRDLLPADTATRDHVLSAITGVYLQYGYQRIETPALENIDRLQSGQGADNEKLIYQVLKRGLPAAVEAGTSLRELVDLGLRYDLTVPLTRFYGANQARLPTPFRSLQVGPVWRAERPQKGRYRQFYQCDIDIIGEPAVLAEAELIEATTEALAAVGLADVAHKRAGGFSLGMSQRLSIAAALLGDPGVLLFDEPVNGLDPEGVRWIRDLMKSLAAEGRTVLLSSHLISEMALIADHLIVIGQGRLLADSTVAELTAGGRSLEEAFFALTSGSAEYRGVAPAEPRRQ